MSAGLSSASVSNITMSDGWFIRTIDSFVNVLLEENKLPEQLGVPDATIKYNRPSFSDIGSVGSS